MSELAFNYKGEPFAPPSEASSWRVRRIREGQRGQLDVVRDAGGTPVLVPIDVGTDGFREAVGAAPGRYRLDALDAHRLPVADCDAAYVTVGEPLRNAAVGAAGASPAPVEYDDAPAMSPAPRPRVASPVAMVTAPFGTWPALPMPDALSGSEYLLAEALRGQVMTIHMLTSALSERGSSSAAGASQMIGAAVDLVRAADGAAMPSRRPPPPPPALPPPPAPSPAPMPEALLAALQRNAMMAADDDDDTEPDAASGPTEQDLFAKVLAIADKVQGVIAPVADVARLVMGGFGNPAALRNAGEVEAPPEDSADEADEAAGAPSHLYTSHMLLIAHELGEDGSRFRRLVMALADDERQALTAHLCALPFDAAVAEAAAMMARLAARRRARGTGPVEVEVEVDADSERAEADDGDGEPLAVEIVDAEPVEVDVEPVVVAEPPVVVVNRMPVSPAGVSPGPQLAMVPTAQLEPVLQEQRQVTPPPGLSGAEVATRMKAITQHLKVTEILKVHSLLGATPQAERDAWSARLLAMPPVEAAALIRAELARRGG